MLIKATKEADIIVVNLLNLYYASQLVAFFPVLTHQEAGGHVFEALGVFVLEVKHRLYVVVLRSCLSFVLQDSMHRVAR